MAYLSVSDITQRGAYLHIYDLQYPASNYQNFEFSLKNTEGDVLALTLAGSVFGNYYNIYLDLNWEGQYWSNGWLAPQSTYIYTARGNMGGTWYNVSDSYTFTTSLISSPSGEYLPTYYPSIRYQTYNSCVAMAISTIMDIFAHKKYGTSNNHYSIAYIYGNRTLQTDLNTESSGMYPYDTIQQNISRGSPDYYLVSSSYPDDLSYINAKILYTNASTQAVENAYYQKFSSENETYFYNASAVSQSITNNGAFMFNFFVPSNFYDVTSDGIVKQPSSRAFAGHSMPLIGWKTISGKKYWIAQNSWGSYWGDNGRCYVPYDWGINCPKPYANNNSYGFSWVQDTYAIINNTLTKPVMRPPLFNWTYAKTQGEKFNLVADEWNGLISNINLLRTYKGFANYSFTTAVSGKPFYASMWNEARAAIQGIGNGAGSLIVQANSGDKITAYNMDRIVQELNVIY